MSPQEAQFLSLRDKPARLTPEQTAWYLGINPDDIPVLIAAGLLKPLGRPARSSIKWTAFVELQRHCADPKWLSKVTEAIQTAGRLKNERRASDDAPER